MSASSKRTAASLCTQSRSKKINACLPVTLHPSVLAGRLAGQVMMRCICADELHAEPGMFPNSKDFSALWKALLNSGICGAFVRQKIRLLSTPPSRARAHVTSLAPIEMTASTWHIIFRSQWMILRAILSSLKIPLRFICFIYVYGGFLSCMLFCFLLGSFFVFVLGFGGQL